MNADILATVRSVATTEECQLQALVDDALADLIEKRKPARPRAHVMTAHQDSHEKYAVLYKDLAE